MSGAKRILVDVSEWQRLQGQASRLAEIRRDLPAMIDGIRRQTQADLAQRFGPVEDRQRRFEQALSGLSEQARQLEAGTTRRLKEQARRMKQALGSTAGELRQETRQLLAEQERTLRSEIAEEQRQRQAQARKLEERLQALHSDREHAAAMAHSWLSDAGTLHDLIRDSLPHERFAPNRLPSLERELAMARENARQGRFDAALAVAQTTSHGLSELRMELELLDREWRLAYTLAIEALAVVQGSIDQSGIRAVHDQDGHELADVTMDVDYWSNGALLALRGEVAQALERLRDEQAPKSTEELRAIVSHQAPDFERRLAEVVQRAAMSQLASQLRVNVADAVAQTLDETAGYELVEGTYAGDDQRNAFYAKLRHHNGNEIVVDVSPEADDADKVVLRLLSYDLDVGAEAEREQRASALADGLRGRGIEVEGPEREAGEPDPAFRDLAVLKRSAPRSAPRQ